MSAITPAIRPAMGPAIRSAFEGGYAPSLLSQALSIVRGYGGALYDLSNPAARFKENTGQTPATTPGDPIGLLLDCQFGLVRGAELLGNPGNPFTVAAPWFAIGDAPFPSLSVVAGRLRLTTNGGISPGARAVVATIPGTFYEVTANLSRSGDALTSTVVAGGVVIGGLGPTRFIYQAVGGTTNFEFAVSGPTGAYVEVSSYSVKEIPGNHLSQPTATARPLYQIIDGFPCVAGDGVDDFLRTPTQIPAGPDRSTTLGVAARLLSESADFRFLAGAGNVSPARGVGIQRVTAALNSYSGLANYGTAVYPEAVGPYSNGVTRILTAITQPDLPRAELQINGASAATRNTTLGSNANGPMTFCLCGSYTGGSLSNSAIFAAYYFPAAPTPAEQRILDRWLAQQSGVTL